jgi:osmoprotectant transport system permease protein
VSEELRELPGLVTAHLQLSLSALLVGTSVSVPLGIALTRRARWEQPVLLCASLIQTIPSLALLALMVPLLAGLGLPSIGYLPAFIALVLYGVLPILRNTVTGIFGVDPALIEAARAVGMTARQELVRVELPLALPVIVAGVRTATSWTVGMATLSTPVGAPSLGNLIFSGLQTRNLKAVLVGCVAAALLALVLDGLARLLLAGVEQRKKPLIRRAAAGFAALYIFAGSSALGQAFEHEARPVAIGAKTFTEQYILGEILAQTIVAKTGARAELKQSLGSTVAFDALAGGQIDAYVDYSGTIWATILRRSGAPPSRRALLAEIRDHLRARYGIHLVGALGFENAYALAMRRAEAEKLGVKSISELTPHAPQLTIGGDYEFFARPEWASLAAKYGLRFRDRRSMDPSLMYEAAAGGSVDVISAFSSDGRIQAFDLLVLADDRGAVPPYDAVILAGKDVPDDVLRALGSLSGRIDAAAMRRMNLEVDAQHVSPREVARRFLSGP